MKPQIILIQQLSATRENENQAADISCPCVGGRHLPTIARFFGRKTCNMQHKRVNSVHPASSDQQAINALPQSTWVHARTSCLRQLGSTSVILAVCSTKLQGRRRPVNRSNCVPSV
ncbi:hypothetical protein HBI56_076910 [Parastagonospora nodorum]|nr:hypothetical protein HBH52_062240 [Parastagonospora nodorum]KAH4037817.1 hypothetical protein HBI09_059320 [Parastagonospora nodorum]KAH4054121.1 hypothetical protein HBH49_076110 [Parastagonospora nodorum]KAH4225987.1 hypothetical protein HBI06_114840 [Parastagonospora nodorum]KAH4247160.1 hypothetical protein HBI05_041610 [Parastagonospora nodorum]